jgi:hypothetical protein
MKTLPLTDPSGRIAACPKGQCGFTCCDFQQGNYIVLHPGELEAAKSRGESLHHLAVYAEEAGGYRATCRARATATCDGGYKPLDCRSYPLFPTVTDGASPRVDVVLKGSKCPLQLDEIREHEVYVRRAWSRVLASSPDVVEWLRRVRLVGYERPGAVASDRATSSRAAMEALG